MTGSVVSPQHPQHGFARKRELWWQFTVRAVEQRHRGSHLGIAWAALNPLLMLTLYFCVFGLIFDGRFGVLPDETRTDYALAVFLGLILFHLIAETLASAPTFIVANPNFVKKVVFPLEILPLAQVSALWFHFLISLSLLLIGVSTVGRGLDVSTLLWLPLVVAPLVLLSIGLAWLLAALGVFFRDIGQVMPFVAQIVLYASAVFYPISLIHSKAPFAWPILKWNPVLHTVHLARDVTLWNVPVNLAQLAYTWACGLAFLVIGRWVFRRSQPAFADVI